MANATQNGNQWRFLLNWNNRNLEVTKVRQGLSRMEEDHTSLGKRLVGRPRCRCVDNIS